MIKEIIKQIRAEYWIKKAMKIIDNENKSVYNENYINTVKAKLKSLK